MAKKTPSANSSTGPRLVCPDSSWAANPERALAGAAESNTAPAAGSRDDQVLAVRTGLRALADALAPVLVEWWAGQTVRAALRSEYDCNLAAGHEQCPFVVLRGDGHACCRFRKDHPGRHLGA